VTIFTAFLFFHSLTFDSTNRLQRFPCRDHLARPCSRYTI